MNELIKKTEEIIMEKRLTRAENGKMLCLTPKVKARCYGSERRKLLSSLIFKIALAALGSVAAFVFTRLLYRFF